MLRALLSLRSFVASPEDIALDALRDGIWCADKRNDLAQSPTPAFNEVAEF